MIILSWNILHGGGSRASNIVDCLIRHAPHIICLQEFRHGPSKQVLVEGLAKAGFAHQFAPEAATTRKNTVAIFSRSPLLANHSQILFKDVDGTARCISVAVEHPTMGRIRVITVSLPHKKAQLPIFDMLLDMPTGEAIDPTIIIGDFNCGIPFEDSETKTFYATHRFQSLLKQGWIDSWRTRNVKAREFTWISTQKGNGFRYDHALSTTSLDQHITQITYDHSVREQRVSDHSLLVVET